MVTLTIDEKAVSVPAGTSVLDAAREAGADIPTLCYEPKLKPYGGCRLCVVQIEGFRAPVPSCATEAAEGMVVETESDLVVRLRRLVIDLLLSNHNADCRDCPSTENCLLRTVANRYGLTETSFVGRFHHKQDKPVDESHSLIIRDTNRCILCGRCVRVCEESVGASAITFAGKGFEAYVTTPYDEPLQMSTCVTCGSCAKTCPTGALRMNERLLERYRLDLQRCMFCGLCVENCPHDALVNGSRYELASADKDCLLRDLYRSGDEAEGGMEAE